VTPGESIPKADYDTPCANGSSICETQMVDGGYVDNSGLLTIVELWPELRRLILEQNHRTPGTPIAVVIVDIDNHYQHETHFEVPSEIEMTTETFLPGTVFAGVASAIESAAYGMALQAHPTTCFVTVAPQIHPGLTAPLGWVLSKSTRAELRDALVRPAPNAAGASLNWPVYRLRRLQTWLEAKPPSAANGPPFTPLLSSCIPTQ